MKVLQYSMNATTAISENGYENHVRNVIKFMNIDLELHSDIFIYM